MASNYKLTRIDSDGVYLDYYGQGMPQPNKLGVPANMAVLGENIRLPYSVESELIWGEMYSVFLFPVVENANEKTQDAETGSAPTTLTAPRTDSGRPSDDAISLATASGDAEGVSSSTSSDRATAAAERTAKSIRDASTPAAATGASEGSSGVKPPAKRS